jgi:hypothetical protein
MKIRKFNESDFDDVIHLSHFELVDIIKDSMIDVIDEMTMYELAVNVVASTKPHYLVVMFERRIDEIRGDSYDDIINSLSVELEQERKILEGFSQCLDVLVDRGIISSKNVNVSRSDKETEISFLSTMKENVKYSR